MPSKPLSIILLSLALLAGVAGASVTAIPFPQANSDLAPDAKAVFATLPNGIRYVFYPNAEPPGRVFAYLQIEAGSAYETEEQQGIAHYLEHMAFNGSANFAPGELVKYFQSIGMSFGGDVNAFTSLNRTVYSLDLPNAEADTLDDAFKLLGDYARRLSLLPEEIDRERGIILAEMRDRDSVGWRTRKAMVRFVYDEATLSRRMPIGLKRTVSEMQEPLFDDFYHTWYRPERMTLVIVGDVAFDQLRPHLEKGFAALKAGAPAREAPSFGDYAHSGTKAFCYSDEEAESTHVEIAIALREPRPRDTAEQRRKETSRNLAEAILRRRLQKLAKQDEAVFTQGTAYSYNAYGWSRHAGIRLTGKPEQWREMMAAAEQALRGALTHGFTQAEVDEVKARQIRALDEAVMKAETRNTRALAGRILGTIGQERVPMSPADRRDLLKPYIAGLDPQSLLEAYRQCWQPEHRLLMVTGNAEAAEKEILAAYAASQQAAIAPPRETERITFAYGVPPAAEGTVARRTRIDDLEIEQIVFGIGARLNLKPTDFKKNEIKVVLRFGDGERAMPEGQDGLNLLAGMTMVEGGLGKHSREELKSVLAGRSAYVGFGVGTDHMAFSGSAIPEDLELTLQLMRAYFTDAAYRPEALRQARKRYTEQYHGMERTPDGIRRLKVERMLNSGDLRFGLPSLTAFNERTAEEVKAWVEREKRATPLEISIVGDVDVEQTVTLAARYFGTLPGIKPVRPTLKPAHLIGPGSHTLSVPTKIDRSQLTLYWKTTDAFSDIHRTRRLSLLAKVFGEYLREEVREKLGGSSTTPRNLRPCLAKRCNHSIASPRQK